MRRTSPDVVVTYDENGFYGHPDHIQAHRITMAAVEPTGMPAKVYWTHGAAVDDGGVRPQISASSAPTGTRTRERRGRAPDIGLPDEEITTWVDTSAFGEQKFDALAAHASQGENIFFLKLGQDGSPS